MKRFLSVLPHHASSMNPPISVVRPIGFSLLVQTAEHGLNDLLVLIVYGLSCLLFSLLESETGSSHNLNQS